MERALPKAVNEFVNEAQYQQIVDDMISYAKSKGADQSEVNISASVGLQVSTRLQEVETLEFNRDKSVQITVYVNKHKGSASTSDISADSIKAAVDAAVNLAKYTQADEYAGLAEAMDMAKDITSLDLYHPWDISVDQAIKMAKACEQAAFAVDKKIVNSEGASLSTGQGFIVYGNSHGFRGAYPTSKHSLSCVLIAQDVQGMERDHDYTISRIPENLASAAEIGKSAAGKALARLSAKKLPTQRTPVLFHSTVASGIISHFLTAISGGRLFRNSSFLIDSLHKKLFQDHIHIFERPHIKAGLASSAFDNNGVTTYDKDFIRDGIVQNYILSAYSARRLGLANTANAGGTSNVFIEPGKNNFDQLIKKMHRGLVVTELMGQGVNLVTGDYSRGATGFWVENGEIKYPVHEVTIAGNLRNMFGSLVEVGTDIEKRSSIQTGSLLIEEMTLAGV